MSETGRVELDLQKEVFSNIPYVDTTTNQPIPDTGDQSETNAYEGFLDLGFMPQAVVLVVHLNVFYDDLYLGGGSSRN